MGNEKEGHLEQNEYIWLSA